ncbi:hypothetical protein GARC_4326 [Paraglaciecola arctica BSs20135]|uniref:Uncharacterized protein n=1 Tax=Paraglaciecola arctica BSs20135 TaxID=493475 RepID=K6YX06_9ALTE|nr:hypothetical protein GARC_4326 [Paraglaciecola arctica BSs20135]
MWRWDAPKYHEKIDSPLDVTDYRNVASYYTLNQLQLVSAFKYPS